MDKTSILSLILIISLMLNVYFIPSNYNLEVEVRRLRSEVNRLNMLISELQQEMKSFKPMLKTEGIGLGFMPNATVQYVNNSMITYIGFVVTVENLSKIKLRPVDVILDLNVNVTASEGGNLTYLKYYYRKNYAMRVEDPVNYVMIPYSIYPIVIMNQTIGSGFTFNIYITVKVAYKGEVIYTAETRGVRTLVVAG